MPPTPGSTPDPSPQRLRALAHPLRWRLLDVISAEDSATATRCAELLGESVASCAYHLGILGKYGYLERVPDVPGREKPWRAVDQVQHLAPVGPSRAERQASEAAVDAFLEHEFDQIRATTALRVGASEEWRSAAGNGGSTLWVTAGELAELRQEMVALLLRHRERGADPALRPESARRVRLFFSAGILPEP